MCFHTRNRYSAGTRDDDVASVSDDGMGRSSNMVEEKRVGLMRLGWLDACASF